jgi:imidazolonepropionase-like amidohydrolase
MPRSRPQHTGALLVAIVLATAACRSGGAPKRVTALDGDVAFVGVNVVTMAGDEVLRDRVVLVRGDRIVAVAAAGAVKFGGGTTRLDAHGKWLMPGLVDMHVHIRDADDLPGFVAAGVTTVRNMWGRLEHLEQRKRIAAGVLIGPTIVTAGNIVDGEPPRLSGSQALTNVADIPALIAEHERLGYDFVKVFDGLDATVYAALAKAAHDAGLPIVGHVPTAAGLDGALAAGQDSFEHLDGWDVVAERDRAAMIRRMGQAKARICPTLIVQQAHGAQGEAAAQADFERSRELVGPLVAAGARLLVGTDAGNPGVAPGTSLPREIELLVETGLSRAQVVRAATAGAADSLGSDAGFVRPGAIADLVLVDANPLEAPIGVPAGVMLRGRWLPGQQLDGLARDTAAARRAQLQALPAYDLYGTDRLEAHYVYWRGDTSVGEEWLVLAPGLRGPQVAARLVLEAPAAMSVAYRITADATDYQSVLESHAVTLSGHLARGRLTVSGTGTDGAPVELTEPFPANAFLSGPGVGGLMVALPRPATLPVGAKQDFVAMELGYYPAAKIEVTPMTIERKPDTADGVRFGITIPTPRRPIESEIVIGRDGLPVEQTYGPPLNLRVRRVFTTQPPPGEPAR